MEFCLIYDIPINKDPKHDPMKKITDARVDKTQAGWESLFHYFACMAYYQNLSDGTCLDSITTEFYLLPQKRQIYARVKTTNENMAINKIDEYIMCSGFI